MGKFRNLYYGLNKYVFSMLPDSLYHNLLGWIMHRRFNAKYHWMNINTPRTYSEKLQWLKKHGANIELKTLLADKYDVRQYVADVVGRKYLVDIVPLAIGGYWVTSADEIDFERLPNEFVLKMTKGSGYNLICRNKSALDTEATRSILRKWLKVNNYYLGREPQYRGQNRIYCERMLEYNITDYKFFCFNGEPFMFKIDVNRFTKHRANYYDMNCNLLSIDERVCPRDASVKFDKPTQFEEMTMVTRKLAKGFPFVRIDLYIHDGKVYFGEMTFHPGGGYAPITPYEWELKLGKMIQLYAYDAG